MDRLTALNAFRQAVELGSFTAAADRLGLSPPAVSKSIRELETHLSARLLHRTTRRMSLTEAGSLYYERVVQVLDGLEEADGLLAEMRATPRGQLRVSAPMTVSLLFLSAAIPRFLQQYPEISLDLQLDDRRVDIVERGLDLALRGSDHLEDSSLVARKLVVMDHVICASPVYFERAGVPNAPADLAQHECVRFSLTGHANLWTFRKEGRTETLEVTGRYVVGSSLAVRDALCAGFGLSLVPEMYVREELAEGRLVTALEEYALDQTTLYAVYPSRRYLDSKVRAFIEFLSEELEPLGHSS